MISRTMTKKSLQNIWTDEWQLQPEKQDKNFILLELKGW